MTVAINILHLISSSSANDIDVFLVPEIFMKSDDYFQFNVY
jgi:hypothetical protein